MSHLAALDGCPLELDKLSSYPLLEAFIETIPVGKLKARFAAVLATVRAGGSVIVSYGRKHESGAALVPLGQLRQPVARRLGSLAGRASVAFASDFEMTEEEFLGP